MNEMLNLIELEKRIQQSFKAVKQDIAAFKQQLSAKNPAEEKLKKELFFAINNFEQQINERTNNELKQQNKLLQEILDKVRRSESKNEKNNKINNKIINDATAVTSYLSDMKKQLSTLEKQQKALLDESIDFTEVEQHFMTEKGVISLINEKYLDQMTKQSQQMHNKFASLRHEFDDLLKSFVQHKKNVQQIEKNITHIEAKTELTAKNAKKHAETVITTIRKKMASVENNITAQVKQNDIGRAIERVMDELAVLKQKSMSREEVGQLFENFSKKINSIREELDDFERNLDTVSMQTRDFQV